VFLSDVRVPANNLLCPLNGGWRVANGSLGYERTLMWTAFADRLAQMLSVHRPAGALDRDHYATAAMEYQALRLLGSAAISQAARGERDIPAVSVLKVLGSEAELNAYRQCLEAAGLEGLDPSVSTGPFNPYAPQQFTASWFTRYLGSFAGTIAGGTSEIQRNIIAQRILGLPAR
jgi:alkylation response protein AidB-like acyl-CoA dehydrogenase